MLKTDQTNSPVLKILEVVRTKYCPTVRRAVTLRLELETLPLRPSFAPVTKNFDCDSKALCTTSANDPERPRVNLNVCVLARHL